MKRLVPTSTVLVLLLAGCGGSKKVAVPDLRGKPTKVAFKVLANRRLCPAERPAVQAAARVRLGTVVDQDPTPGAIVHAGALVTVWVKQRTNHAVVIFSSAPC